MSTVRFSRGFRLSRRIILGVVSVMAACGGTGSVDRHTLIDSRDNYDPRSLDPALSTDVPTGRAVSYVFDGLTRFTPKARVVPDLATSWDLASDGVTYTFHLRTGVRFHDGTSFSAADVRHSWERVLDPHTPGGRGWPLYPIRGAQQFAAGTASSIAGLAVVDDSTIRITLGEPFAIFPKIVHSQCHDGADRCGHTSFYCGPPPTERVG